jgi:hypothetical protein
MKPKSARKKSKVSTTASRKPRRDKGTRPTSDDEDIEPLSPSQLRELKRRAEDYEDPTRYLLVSSFGPRFNLYYNVSDDVYVMNEPKGATLFKRREAALAVLDILGSGNKIIKCTTRRVKGERVPVLGKRSKLVKGRKK